MANGTYNASFIFGPAPEMNHEDPVNAAQINHYPGTLGVERIDLGMAESYTIVRGELNGATTDDLADACQTIRALKIAGTTGTLIDTDGATWTDAVIQSFATKGRSVFAAGVGWTRAFEVRILHTGLDPSTGTAEPTST